MSPINYGKPNSIIRLFRNFRMQTQILILNFIILCLIIPLIIGTQQINNQFLREYLKESQEDILFRQNSGHIESVMDSFQQQIKFFYQKTQTSLYKVNCLYKQVQMIELQFSESIQKCYDYNEDEIYPIDSKYPLLCVTTFKASQAEPLPNLQKYKVFSDFDLIFDEMLFLFDPSDEFLPDNIYIVMDDNLETSAWWPQWVKWEGYHPQERPWYTTHKEKFLANPQQFDQISDLYEFYSDKPVMAMTATHTLNSNGLFEGVIASDIELDYNYFKYDSLSVMLIALDGTLIITNYENKNIASSLQTYKFYDQQITGFNQDDWNQIQLYINNQVFVSNCQQKNYPTILCRFNQITQQDVIFSIRLLDNPNYIIVIFNNMTLDYEVMQNSQLLLNDLNQSFFNQFAIISATIICLLIFQTAIIWKLFHPLYQLIMHSKIYIKSNSNQLLFRQEQYYLSSLNFSPYFGSNVMTTLKLAYKSIYNRLCSQTTKKSVQCKLLQKYQYPKIPHILYKIKLSQEIGNQFPSEQAQTLNLIKRALILASEQK